MKTYIEAKSSMKNGSYVVDRDGTIYNIGMHVPSTTYLGRGIYHLALTDADFLLSQGLINEKEATAIVLYCYVEFLKNECNIADPDEIIPLIKLTEFSSYAETKYAPKARNIFFKQNLRTVREIEELMESLPDFETLNNKWYTYLKDNYCKISKFGDVVEFRISSDDFDWNPVIIDKVIMKYDSGKPYSTRYNIMKESDKGYQSYFENATLEDILQNDKAVLSSEYLERKIINSEVKYMKKRIIGSTYKYDDRKSLKDWCETLSKKIHTLYMHETNGTILGKFSVEDAIAKYGDCIVTGSYSDGEGQISVWISNHKDVTASTGVNSVYNHSAEYAMEHDELDAYRKSFKENMNCRDAIQDSIDNNYHDNRIDTSKVLEEVVQKYGIDRVIYVLANTIQMKSHDGRISDSNKRWAETIDIVEDTSDSGDNRNRRFIVDRVNPGLVDLLVSKLRKSY